jgi:hypothetical protein
MMRRMVRRKPSKQITLRGLEPALEKRIRELATRGGISLNQAALILLRQGAEISREKRASVRSDGLDRLFGLWTKQEADQFDEFMKDNDHIDPSFWFWK